MATRTKSRRSTKRRATKRTTKKRATKRATKKVAAKRATKKKGGQSDVQIAFANARKFYGGKIPKGTKLARFYPKGGSRRVASKSSGNPGGTSRRAANPGRRRGGSMFKGLGGLYVDGALNTIPVMGGKIAARALPVMLKLGAKDPLVTIATELGVAAAGAFLIDQLGYGAWGRLFFTGGALAVAESAAKRYNVPGAEFLCDGTDVLAGYTYEMGNIESMGPDELSRLYASGGANLMGRHLGLYPGVPLGTYVT